MQTLSVWQSGKEKKTRTKIERKGQTRKNDDLFAEKAFFIL